MSDDDGGQRFHKSITFRHRVVRVARDVGTAYLAGSRRSDDARVDALSEYVTHAAADDTVFDVLAGRAWPGEAPEQQATTEDDADLGRALVAVWPGVAAVTNFHYPSSRH